MMVWVFVLTLLLSGGAFVVEYGPYPTREACQAARDALNVAALRPMAWSLTVCYTRPAAQPAPLTP